MAYLGQVRACSSCASHGNERGVLGEDPLHLRANGAPLMVNEVQETILGLVLLMESGHEILSPCRAALYGQRHRLVHQLLDCLTKLAAVARPLNQESLLVHNRKQ